MTNNIEDFHDLAVTIAAQETYINFQERLIAHYRAKNYSIIQRNRFLVRCNRALYVLIAILLLFIFVRFVVG